MDCLVLFYDICIIQAPKSRVGEKMGKRITVNFDDKVIRKLRMLQAKRIIDVSDTVTLSEIINDVLQKHLK